RGLARMIASTGLSVLHERLSGMQLEVAPEQLRWAQSPFLRGLNQLPVTFVPAAPKGPQAPDPAPRPRRAAATGPEEPEDLLDRLLNWWRGLRGRGGPPGGAAAVSPPAPEPVRRAPPRRNGRTPPGPVRR